VARQLAAATPQAPSSPRFSFGALLAAARHAHPEFRRQARLEQRLGWPNRKLVWLEHDRIKPTAEDLEQLTAVLPILRLLLERARPAERAVETLVL
jgi:hypothetical protein